MDSCPICHSSKNKTTLCKVSFTHNTEYDLSECPECRVIYCNPTPTTEQFIDFYSIGGYEFDRWKQEAKAKSYIRKLQKKQTSGKFLDVGCATGYLINGIARHSTWEVYGVELSENPARFARDVLGLKNITHGDLFSAAYPDSFFDCINISDVLEHVPDPVAFLTECRRVLKPDGIVMLGVPNGYNDSRGLIRYYNTYKEAGCHASGHIFFFQEETFKFLFDAVGFTISEAETLGIKNGLRNIGRLPAKRHWMNFYRPHKEKEIAVESEIKLITRKKYPDIYYQYRYLKHGWFSLKGIHNFGLDINFTLIAS
jgi:ubiquinone/menaquinone biosynthesis C-methylase UbiE